MSRGRERGALAIVLHTHMPYVEGFSTWPFGEEWLWEAIAGSYVPLLELLDGGAPLTLSLTPVLCDQLEAPGLTERFSAFVREVRRGTHERDAAGLRAGGHERLARELERSWGDYAGAAERLSRRGSDLLARLLAHAQWTSSATHAVLPLIATDAGLRLQVHSGVAAHRRRCDGRVCAVARADPALRGRHRGVRGADPSLRARGARAPVHVRKRVRHRARADRPRHHLAGVERARLSGQRLLPRLPPPHRPPPQPLEQRRRRVRPRRRGCAGAPARGGLRGAHPRPPARRGID